MEKFNIYNKIKTMRKFDKILNLKKANLLAENRYLESKGFGELPSEDSIPQFNNTTELVDYLVNKSLNVDNKYVDWDVKREIYGFEILGKYKVETTELNYTLVINTSYVSNRDPNYGGFQGETIWLTNFDNVGDSWSKYEQLLNQIEDEEVEPENLSRETQDKLEHHIEEFKTAWWNDQHN
jgi:hypothetical protein